MSYEQAKEMARLRSAKKSRDGRNISPIPPIQNPERRASAWDSLKIFCEVYLSLTFNLAWSPGHLLLIAKLEDTIINGGQQAIAMPRGTGKSSLCEAAILWAVLTGRRKFAVLVGATSPMAAKLLANVRKTLEDNELLLADFPEVCYPIVRLQHIIGRCAGQHIDGKNTLITLKSEMLVLPTVEGSIASGAVIVCAGLETGQIRGLRHKLASGETIRPDVFLLDDPQTKSSALSLVECQRREEIVGSELLKLAGPTKKIAGLITCTVIRAGDLADRLLDRKLYPTLRGMRTKLFNSMPKSEKLWEQYRELRAESFLNGGKGEPATEFYRANQQAMDLGCEPTWPERFEEGQISAVQFGMDNYLDNAASFFAEFQNEPLTLDSSTFSVLLDEKGIAAKIQRGFKRGTAPQECERLALYVDCHDKLLYWLVLGYTSKFQAWVVDYGTWPQQKKGHFALADTKLTTLAMKHPGKGKDGALLAGVVELLDTLLAKSWRSDDLRIGSALVDSGYKPDIVHQAIRQSRYASLVMASKGRGIKAGDLPFSQYRHYPGDRAGAYWRIPARRAKNERPTVHIDVNTWKTKLMEMLACPMGDRGCLVLPEAKDGHRMLIEHILSESCKETIGNGRTVTEWKPRVGRPDNHWLDCLVGCLVGASMNGASTLDKVAPNQPKRRRITYANESKPVPALPPHGAPYPAEPITPVVSAKRKRGVSYIGY